MKRGIVLAAGMSTRMKNKVLLPIRSPEAVTTEPCIMSAVRFCERSRCEKITVVTSPQSVAREVINACGYEPSFVVQESPDGILDAVAHCNVSEYEDVLITFGDNVYAFNEKCIGMGYGASTRLISDHGHLDRWDGSGWAKRDPEAVRPQECFAGWIFCQGPDIIGATGPLLDWMNDVGLKAILLNSPWHDVGTPESYQKYWMGNVNS